MRARSGCADCAVAARAACDAHPPDPARARGGRHAPGLVRLRRAPRERGENQGSRPPMSSFLETTSIKSSKRSYLIGISAVWWQLSIFMTNYLIIVHDNQEGRFYHGYYHHYCFLSLHVFCDKQLLVSYQRPSDQDGAKHSWAILALLVEAFRKEWPDVRIIFRGDGGFCRHRMFDWCERNNVLYITGMARNKALERSLAQTMKNTQDAFESSKKKQREFVSFEYQSKDFLLIDNGRQSGEFSFVYVEDNKFLGYGYYELNHQIKTKDQIESRLIPIEDNLDTQKLIHSFILRKKYIKLINLQGKD